MDNNSLTPCQINQLYNERLIEVEYGNVIYTSNATSFWTIFTLVWSSMGITLSAAALLLLTLTALLFAEWRNSYKNQLLIQFMIARFLYTFVRFFCDIQKLYNMCPYSARFYLLDIHLMMYTESALVVWMFIFSRQIYVSLVKVFTTERCGIWKLSLCAWLGPTSVVVLLRVMVHFGPEVTRWYIFLYLITIKWPILFANAVLLILALRSVLKNNLKSEKNLRIILVMIVLIFLFGFQQVVIDLIKIVFLEIADTRNIVNTTLIVSNILSMYHCAFSVCFWVLGNANTRKLWRFQSKDLRTKLRLSISS